VWGLRLALLAYVGIGVAAMIEALSYHRGNVGLTGLWDCGLQV
jgi:hypothetical protein